MRDSKLEAEQYLTIDWSQEPRSEREAKIRAALLRRQLATIAEDPFGAAMRLREKMGFRRANECATDIREAWDQVRARCDALRRGEELREIEEAIHELDRGT